MKGFTVFYAGEKDRCQFIVEPVITDFVITGVKLEIRRSASADFGPAVIPEEEAQELIDALKRALKS